MIRKIVSGTMSTKTLAHTEGSSFNVPFLRGCRFVKGWKPNKKNLAALRAAAKEFAHNRTGVWA